MSETRTQGPRVVLIVQARMGSTRLPGKSMMLLAGRPLIQRLLERLKRCGEVDQIVLATTRLPADDALARLGEASGVAVFRGAETDLVDRYLQAAREYGAELIVRVPGDNPVAEPSEIDRLIRHHVSSGNDFTTGYPDVIENGFPDGIGAEVFSMSALERAAAISGEPRNREHPHTNFYEHPDRFIVGTLDCPPEIRRPDIVLDVNTRSEFDFIAALYEELYPQNPRFGIRDVIQWYDEVYLPSGRSAAA